MTTLTRTIDANPLAAFQVLDTHARGAVTVEGRIDALATISAGSKNGKAPSVNRDGRISLHDPEGRAAGLAAALNATDGKTLTIAFPFDDPAQFIQQRFAEYSASRLLAYGDAQGVTVIGERGERVQHPAGSPEYDAVVSRCKVTVSVYFTLATWGVDGRSPAVVFPDGLGFYRLRFTSRNSLQNLVAALQLLGKLSGGRIAGVPLDLQLVNREVTGPDGSRRTVPVWTFTMRPPQTLQLSSANFQATLGLALAAGEALVLPAPAPETIDVATVDVVPDDEPQALPAPLTAREEVQLATGFNPDQVRRRYFAVTQDTPYRDRPGRAQLVEAVTAHHYEADADQVTDSLSTLLDRADQDLADLLIVTAEEWVRGWQTLVKDVRTAYASAKAVGRQDDADALQGEFEGWRKDPAQAARLLERLQRLSHFEPAETNPLLDDGDLAASAQATA